MVNEVWEDIKEFYNNEFGISPELVDVMSSLEILVMCVSGYSNATISKTLSISEREVSSVIRNYLRFDGFSTDLKYSPIREYGTNRDSLEPEIKNACDLYSILESLLDENWI